jgi:osmotically-inducible protein OsmY
LYCSALVPGSRPKSYDEIVRATVPEPDSGFRPTRDEEQLARHRDPDDHSTHGHTQRELDTLARVEAALRADPNIDTSDVHLDIDREALVITGTVPGTSTSARIDDVVGAIDGVERIANQLIVRGLQ